MPIPIIIAIAGPHGSGKSTVAKKIAKEFGFRYLSAGSIFRKIAKERGVSLEDLSYKLLTEPEVDEAIDNRTKEEAKKGNVVIDAQLAGWMTKGINHFSVLITASFETRCKRIAKRDGKSLEEATRETKTREETEAKRFKELYGIDVGDLSIYDLVISTERLDANDTIKLVRSAIAEVVLPKYRQHLGE